MLHDKGELKLQMELWLLYEVPVAAITGYSKLGGLEQKKLSHRSEGQNSESKTLEVLGAAEGENLFLASSSFRWLLVFLGLWVHHLALCLLGLVAFSSSVHITSFCLSI